MGIIFLGDARAEQDGQLFSAFYESPDYRTLIESESKSIVVGRRGVGKSALFLRLAEYYRDADKIEVVRFAPEEHEILAFRSIGKHFLDRFNLVRAATRLAFRYALMMELSSGLSLRFKFTQADGSQVLLKHLQDWKGPHNSLAKLKKKLDDALEESKSDPESAIGVIADKFRLSEVESALRSVLSEMKRRAVFLVDRLDEGYQPDDKGVAIVDGFLNAAIDLKDKISDVRCVVFLRDNIYRAVERFDDDFSRNLEQSVLRLHWDERGLLNFSANRIRVSCGIKAEKSIRVWDSVTQGTLQGELGFHQCLKLTLFRPRDLLLLLNEAFRQAHGRQVFQISQEDINSSAQSISQHRLRDLEKEYDAHIPGLGELARSFSNDAPSLSFSEAQTHVSSVLDSLQEDPRVAQQFELFDAPADAIRALYSVGFIGIRDEGANNFVFCHDGRKPDKDFSGKMSLMIHPCYWMALNLKPREYDESDVTEIYDEYDVTVVSETPEQRAKSIGRLEADLRNIELGIEGASSFEHWCLKVVRVLFSAGLRNIECAPNKDNLQRRDIVGTNHGSTEFWRRVREDYSARQVMFEVKNFADLERNEFRQILSYLCQDYGNIGFVITRGEEINLRKDRELAWVRELRSQHGKTVVLVTAKFLVSQLYKVRNPAKHDAGEEALDKLLDTYVRTYFGESSPKPKRRKKNSPH
ncbi:P-loop ATPase, Sll1717 family [Xanthomonas arboricola]|uniref:P-loop ATPase, Sll1717 family n=1 Tax=Xanthomonas arboricola TaxID=56448 RepID=UPI000CADFD00|nr:ATP-binding protein [Xanthomonas arboricola]SOU04180.1 hypothetical protein CFBP6773_03857 [Xanthomonas arboricola pv. fragariae]